MSGDFMKLFFYLEVSGFIKNTLLEKEIKRRGDGISGKTKLELSPKYIFWSNEIISPPIWIASTN